MAYVSTLMPPANNPSVSLTADSSLYTREPFGRVFRFPKIEGRMSNTTRDLFCWKALSMKTLYVI